MKRKVYLMGFLTLLMLPLAWLMVGLPNWSSFLQLDSLLSTWTGLGVEFGLLVGFFMFFLTNSEDAKAQFSTQYTLIKSLKLSVFDCVFLAFCAGIGEEFLFRIAVQQWMHPVLATIGFVAIHGYIDPRSWDKTKFGLLITGFILALAYAVSGEQGIWFCVAAHASYDFILFYLWSKEG